MCEDGWVRCVDSPMDTFVSVCVVFVLFCDYTFEFSHIMLQYGDARDTQRTRNIARMRGYRRDVLKRS